MLLHVESEARDLWLHRIGSDGYAITIQVLISYT